MAPMTKSGLVILTTASFAFAERFHARSAHHSHKRSKPYSAAPFGYSNGTAIAVGATGTGTGSPDITSTRTETLYSTIYDTVTAPGATDTAAATGGNLAVSAASVPTCGGTIYVTVTDTVTAGTGSASSTSAAAASSSTTTSVAPVAPAGGYGSAPAVSSSAAATTPAASTSSAAASSAPAPYSAPASSAPVAYTTLATTTTPPSTTEVATSAPAPYTSSAAAPTTTTSSAASAPTSGLRTKRGCLYNNAGDCAALAGSTDTISWAANWASSSSGGAGSNVFIPQLWGHYSNDGSVDFTNGFTENVQTAINNGATAVMGYNEPDGQGQGQSNLAATGDAITQWKYVSQFSGKATIVSPSVCSTLTNGDYSGLDWLAAFQGAGASWDATGLHFYADCSADVTTQLSYLKSFVDQAHSQFGKPVWVTEFGCDNAQDVTQNEAFINVAIPYLEGEAKVAQYAYFKADYLVSGSSANAAGTAYASLAIN